MEKVSFCVLLRVCCWSPSVSVVPASGGRIRQTYTRDYTGITTPLKRETVQNNGPCRVYMRSGAKRMLAGESRRGLTTSGGHGHWNISRVRARRGVRDVVLLTKSRDKRPTRRPDTNGPRANAYRQRRSDTRKQ